ncbi:hypothetical protein CLOBOL_01146 [Enterocloster bolteae ATCC BAA-613]|uniref:Uncharacterized protein n=1 Tax=Enterocloster bolteae (strain ATCC BAA-613 / DSM 15670 / CCUG 46953 / JCM 12243 / WAL 16351) TaxID=411902 RepID=A8RJ98_ENTBW|nr:hypothetical protein CLOBOL_01146 [Enterocloster bolteae ATCC BAA-613]
MKKFIRYSPFSVILEKYTISFTYRIAFLSSFQYFYNSVREIPEKEYRYSFFIPTHSRSKVLRCNR